MGAATLIYIVAISIFSMAFVFVFMLLRNVEVTEERLTKILGKDAVEKLKAAKNDDEIKEVIRSLHKRRKTKLKTLLESQDIRDAVAAIKKHILKIENE
jgi:predicted CopG family antitoxin